MRGIRPRSGCGSASDLEQDTAGGADTCPPPRLVHEVTRRGVDLLIRTVIGLVKRRDVVLRNADQLATTAAGAAPPVLLHMVSRGQIQFVNTVVRGLLDLYGVGLARCNRTVRRRAVQPVALPRRGACPGVQKLTAVGQVVSLVQTADVALGDVDDCAVVHALTRVPPQFVDPRRCRDVELIRAVRATGLVHRDWSGDVVETAHVDAVPALAPPDLVRPILREEVQAVGVLAVDHDRAGDDLPDTAEPCDDLGTMCAVTRSPPRLPHPVRYGRVERLRRPIRLVDLVEAGDVVLRDVDNLVRRDRIARIVPPGLRHRGIGGGVDLVSCAVRRHRPLDADNGWRRGRRSWRVRRCVGRCDCVARHCYRCVARVELIPFGYSPARNLGSRVRDPAVLIGARVRAERVAQQRKVERVARADAIVRVTPTSHPSEKAGRKVVWVSACAERTERTCRTATPPWTVGARVVARIAVQSDVADVAERVVADRLKRVAHHLCALGVAAENDCLVRTATDAGIEEVGQLRRTSRHAGVVAIHAGRNAPVSPANCWIFTALEGEVTIQVAKIDLLETKARNSGVQLAVEHSRFAGVEVDLVLRASGEN
jgi:hypothetical protein